MVLAERLPYWELVLGEDWKDMFVEEAMKSFCVLIFCKRTLSDVLQVGNSHKDLKEFVSNQCFISILVVIDFFKVGCAK